MAVKVFPFIYTALFIVLFGIYTSSGGLLLDLIDYFCFVSPVVVVAHLVYSRMLKMCKWHRVACALPLIPQAFDIVDTYILHYSDIPRLIVIIVVILTMILFLLCIYKVFFTDDGRLC